MASEESTVKTTGLTDKQVEQYRRDGYVVASKFFGSETLERIDQRIRRVTEDALGSDDYSNILEVEPDTVGGQVVPRRIYNPYDLHADFKNLATDPRLLDCVESLIGANFNLQHSKLNMKPPGVGSVVEWHQDLAYFPHTNDDLVTLLIYLDDATRANGCLRVLSRHHTHFFDHATPDGKFAGMITEDLETGQFGKPVSLEAPAGSVIFMHCITPHSSHPNRSGQPRRTLIYEYRASDALPIYYGDMAQIAETKNRPIRGEPARFARCGGPAPYIPNVVGMYASLYQLQEDTRAVLAESARKGRPDEAS